MTAPRAPERPRRLQKRLLVPPDCWTAEQPEFLGFSFPSCPRPVFGPTTDPREVHTRDPKLKSIRRDLNDYKFGMRHAGVWQLFDDPDVYHKPIEMVFFRYRRRRHFAKLNCLVLLPSRIDPRKANVAAYVDEGRIHYSRALTATTESQFQAVNSRVCHPYLAALLIALAQDRRRGYEKRVTASVVFSENPDPFARDPVREFHIYTARIPVALLKYLRRPTIDRPDYGKIKVSCISVPAEPLETLRERIVMMMPDDDPDNLDYDSTDEEQESAVEDQPSTVSSEHAGETFELPAGSSEARGPENGTGQVGVST